ncbi:MAG: hypothetical protein U9O98_04690, partial [Asgard group archaeon]|nr:hypothetical protein [Asgard group archaeon]
MNVPKENITIHGYDTYIEDFTTTTYKSGATNAFGWGTSTLSKRRNMTAQTLDFFPTADPVRSIDVQGRKAYFGIYNKSMGPPSMGVLDITRPDHLSAKGLSAAWPETTAVAINGDVFYTGQVTIGGYGLCIYNYSNSYSI